MADRQRVYEGRPGLPEWGEDLGELDVRPLQAVRAGVKANVMPASPSRIPFAGLLESTKSLPALPYFLGDLATGGRYGLSAKAPQFAVEASGKYDELINKYLAKEGLGESSKLPPAQQFGLAAGEMLGQLPIPGKLLESATKALPKAFKPAGWLAEYFGPTVDPKAVNYAVGTGIGGSLRTATSEEEPEKFAKGGLGKRPHVEKRTVYRGGSQSTFRLFPKDMTADDIIRYEIEELGNEASTQVMPDIDLKSIPARSLDWVTFDEASAQRYADPDLGETVEGREETFRIIAKDDEGGYLIQYLPEPEKFAKGGLGRKPIVRTTAEGVVETAPPTATEIRKEPGGNWLPGSIERIVEDLRSSLVTMGDRPADRVLKLEEYAKENPWVVDTPAFQRDLSRQLANAPVDKWLETKLTNYIKNDMATERDPVRKGIEQRLAKADEVYARGKERIAKSQQKVAEAKARGQNTAAVEDRLAQEMADLEQKYGLDKLAAGVTAQYGNNYRVGARAERQFSNSPALASTPESAIWEDMTDVAVDVGENVYVRNRPFLPKEYAEELSRIPYDAKVYELRNSSGFNNTVSHIRDELLNSLREGTDLPPELRLKADDLQKMNMDAAVAHVGKVDAWRERNRIAADLLKSRNAATVTFKEYPGTGLEWKELKMPEPKFEEGHAPGPVSGYPSLSGIIDQRTGQSVSIGATPEEALGLYKREERTKLLEEALEYEGRVMGHCVGGYCPQVASGQRQIFSLRDAKGEPHVTIEVIPGQDSPPEIIQIKGKGNRKPADKYIPFVQDFVKSQQWNAIGDIRNTNMRRPIELSRTDVLDLGLNEEEFANAFVGRSTDYFTDEEMSRIAKEFKSSNPPRFADGGAVRFAKGGLGSKMVQRTAEGVVEASPIRPIDIMKNPGGNWEAGSVERMLDQLRPRGPKNRDEALVFGGHWAREVDTPEIQDLMRQNAAMSEWIDKKLKNYIRNDMATERDPVRLGIEQRLTRAQEEKAKADLRNAKKREKISAARAQGNNTTAAERQLEQDIADAEQDYRMNQAAATHMRIDQARRGGPEPSEGLIARRIAAGAPPENLATTDLSAFWEKRTDTSFGLPKNAGDAVDPKSWLDSQDYERFIENNPWALKVPPNTKIYNILPDVGRYLQLDHLRDELEFALYDRTNMPPELRLTPEDLSKMSMDAAVAHVGKINAWREREKVAADLLRSRNAATVTFKEYPEAGLEWKELKMPSNEQGGRKTLEDALGYEGDVMGHCVGGRGYCDKVVSGEGRIFSLRDAKGEPHVTIEVIPGEPWNQRSAESFFSESPELETSWVAFSKEMNAAARAKGVDRDRNYVLGFPDWLAQNQPEVFAKYQNMFQDSPPRIKQIKGKGNLKPADKYLPFVQDFVRSQKWGRVGDFHNTGLVNLHHDSELADAIRAAGREPPRFITQEELSGYSRWFNEGRQRGDPFPEFADGGAVKKEEYDPSAIEAIVAPLRRRLEQYFAEARAVPRKLKQAASDVTAIGPIIRKSKDIPLSYYGIEGEAGGKADAMRHLLFQAQLAQKYGETPATMIGYIHEYTSPGQPAAEREMDMFNDVLGREIGQRAKDEAELISLARKYVDSGRAKTLPPAQQGGY